MLKLALIELEYHGECLRVLLELLQNSSNVELTCLVHKTHVSTVLKYIDSDQVHCYEEGESRSKFLAKKKHVLAKADGVFVLTLEQHWRAYISTVKQNKTLIRVHGLNYIQSSRTNYLQVYRKLGLVGVLRAIKWNDIYYKSKVLKHVDALTPTLNLLGGVKKELPYIQKWIDVIPMTYNRYAPQKEGFSPDISVCIPGAVSSNKRDYHLVLKVIELLKNESITWIFAGSAKASELLKDLKRLKNAGHLIRYYEHEVPQELYDQLIKKSHLIWAPLQKTHPFKGVIEQPGKTKITGSESDAIYFGKPLLMPSFYNTNPNFEKGVITYNTEDEVVQKLKKFLEQPATFVPKLENSSLQEATSQTTKILSTWLNS